MWEKISQIQPLLSMNRDEMFITFQNLQLACTRTRQPSERKRKDTSASRELSDMLKSEKIDARVHMWHCDKNFLLFL